MQLYAAPAVWGAQRVCQLLNSKLANLPMYMQVQTGLPTAICCYCGCELLQSLHENRYNHAYTQLPQVNSTVHGAAFRGVCACVCI